MFAHGERVSESEQVKCVVTSRNNNIIFKPQIWIWWIELHSCEDAKNSSVEKFPGRKIFFVRRSRRRHDSNDMFVYIVTSIFQTTWSWRERNITNDLPRTYERGETSSLLRHRKQQTNVVFSQPISLADAFFQNMEKRCDWLRISRANLFRFSSGKKESALWDEYF